MFLYLYQYYVKLGMQCGAISHERQTLWDKDQSGSDDRGPAQMKNPVHVNNKKLKTILGFLFIYKSVGVYSRL